VNLFNVSQVFEFMFSLSYLILRLANFENINIIVVSSKDLDTTGSFESNLQMVNTLIILSVFSICLAMTRIMFFM